MKKSSEFILILFISFFVFANDTKNQNSIAEKKIEALNLNQLSMKEAARLISLATSTPIIVTNNAAKIMIDLHLENVTAKTALDAICKSSGLWYQKSDKDGILQVMTMEELKNSLQFAREEKVEVIQILYPSAQDVGDAIAKLYVNRIIWVDPKQNSGDRYSDINKALKRMDLLGQRGTFDINDSSNGGNNNSGNNNYGFNDNNDYNNNSSENSSSNSNAQQKTEAENATKFDTGKLNDNLVKKVLSQNNQLQATLKFHELSNNPGVVFLSVLPENNSLMLRSSDASSIEQILKVVKQLDKPSPQVLLEVKILSVLLNDSRERAIDFLFSTNSGNFSGGFANGLLGTSGGQEILKPGANLVPQGSGIDPKSAIFNVVSNNVRARIQLLEKDERVTQLAAPNLIVSDNESSTLFIGTETTVMEKAQSTTTYTEVSNGVFQPNISWNIESPRRKIGTSLLLTPKIHADKTVTLRLLQEQSSLGSQVKNTYSGGTKTLGNEEQYFVSQDVELQRIVSTVVGRDKDFMVIGGLVKEEVGKTTEKVPVLSAIPFFGELLFTRFAASRLRKEILIIVRPFVMLAPGETQAISQAYLEKVSQHPAAKNDLPSLGVNSPDELAKPKIIDKNDPWIDRMLDKLNSWNIDDRNSFKTEKNDTKKSDIEKNIEK